MKPISTIEWLAELQRLADRSDEGLTAKEWAAEMGVSVDCALRKLGMARDAGWLRAGRRRITDLAGRPSTSPVYQIVKPKP